MPNIVVGLKSHIVPTGKVKSDMALFPYVQFPITIGELTVNKVCFGWNKNESYLLAGPAMRAALRCLCLVGWALFVAYVRHASNTVPWLPAPTPALCYLTPLQPNGCRPPSSPVAVGMCEGTKGMGQDWGGKCTIDAKRLWKIFYITPGGGGSSANIRVRRGRAGADKLSDIVMLAGRWAAW